MVDTLNVQMKEREAEKEAARKREEVRLGEEIDGELLKQGY